MTENEDGIVKGDLVCDASVLNSLFDIGEMFRYEGKMVFSENGIKMYTHTRDMGAFVKFLVTNEAFENYNLEEAGEISIPLDDASKFAKQFKGEEVKFKICESGGTLVVKFIGMESNKTFELDLLEEADVQELNFDSDEYDVTEVEFDTNDINEAMSDLKKLKSDMVRAHFELKDGELIISGSENTSNYEMRRSVDADGELKARYGHDNIERIAEARSVSDDVDLKFAYSEQKGTVLSAAVVGDGVRVEYLIAPVTD